MNFTSFPKEGCTQGAFAMLVLCEQPDASVDQFNDVYAKNPAYRVEHGGVFGWTALNIVTKNGNIPLIERITELGEENLFLISSPSTHTAGLSPLHSASLCEDPKKGYLAAKKLLQVGSPVNMILDPKYGRGNPKTPMDLAIENGKTKIAALLFRNGGTLLNQKDQDLALIKNEIMYENEKLFKMHFSNPDLLIPRDIVDYILSLSLKVELQD